MSERVRTELLRMVLEYVWYYAGTGKTVTVTTRKVVRFLVRRYRVPRTQSLVVRIGKVLSTLRRASLLTVVHRRNTCRDGRPVYKYVVSRELLEKVRSESLDRVLEYVLEKVRSHQSSHSREHLGQ